MGERFSLQATEHSIAYIPSLILKLSWKACKDIKCNRIASLIISLIYFIALSYILLELYGATAATFGSWFCASTTLLYAIKPADSEMITVYLCFVANTLQFWSLHRYNENKEKNFFTFSNIFYPLLEFPHNLGTSYRNLHIHWFFLSGLKIQEALTKLNAKDIFTITSLFVILCFPMLIFISLNFSEHENKTTELYKVINLNIPSNIKHLYKHIITFWKALVHTLLSFLLLFVNSLVVLRIYIREKTVDIKHKAQLISFGILVLSIPLMLCMIDYRSGYFTDLFMRAIKYIHFFAPISLASTIHLILKNKRKIYLEKNKTLILITAIVLLDLTLIIIDTAHRKSSYPALSLEIFADKKESKIAENFGKLLGRGFVSLKTQRQVTNYLIQNNYTEVYAIIPALSIGFIDVLSADQIKPTYIYCHNIDENFLNTKLWRFIISDIGRKRAKIVTDHYCLNILPEKLKSSLNVLYKFTDQRTGRFEYYISELHIDTSNAQLIYNSP